MAASSSAVAPIWASAAVDGPGQHGGVERGQRQSGGDQHEHQEQQPERQAEQEAHVRGADRAERGRQLLLHGVAQHLAAGRDDREDGP